jgi:Polyketide cyclase / dehydrase and lipid transport
MLGIGGAKPVAGQADDVVKCSTTKAYDFIGRRFFQNYRKWCPQVVELEELSEPPVHLGTRGRQVTRDRGIDSESTFEVSEFSPDRKFEIKGVSEPFRSAYELTSEENGVTRVSFTFELQQLDLAMRPFQKLIRTALQDGAIQTVENIKRLLEGAPAEGHARSARRVR